MRVCLQLLRLSSHHRDLAVEKSNKAVAVVWSKTPIVQPRQALSLGSSCLILPCAAMTGVHHHAHIPLFL